MSRSSTVVKPKSPGTPEARLRVFVARFGASGQRLFRSVRTALRKRFPGANELAYDYNHSVVIAYSPTDRGIEAVASIALLADGVRLHLMHGPKLPDPKKLLQGSAKQVRFIAVEAARQMLHPDVEALLAAACDHATVPLAANGKGNLIIKTDSAAPRRHRNAGIRTR